MPVIAIHNTFQFKCTFPLSSKSVLVFILIFKSCSPFHIFKHLWLPLLYLHIHGIYTHFRDWGKIIAFCQLLCVLHCINETVVQSICCKSKNRPFLFHYRKQKERAASDKTETGGELVRSFFFFLNINMYACEWCVNICITYTVYQYIYC